MPHCRWSDLDYGCDLHCYESQDGFVTHVAATRVVGTVPHLPTDWFRRDDEDWDALRRSRNEFLETCERRPIGLPHDGASFTDGDLADHVARLVSLKDMGYRLPRHVIPGLEEEMAERADDVDD